jgi:hypothetical protein
MKARMMKKNLNSFATFALLSLILVTMVPMVILPLVNAAANNLDEEKAGEEKGQTSMANGFQGNLCDFSDSACIQANEDQSASGSDNKAIGFNDQSDTAAPSGDKKATTSNNTDILMKIDGIDHSTVKVEVWVTADDGREISKTFNPVPLLHPEDDDRGLIQLPMKVEKGLLDIGDTYTACIKVIQDTDKYGNKQSCQQGTLTLGGAQEVSNSSNSAAADAGGDSAARTGYNGDGVPVMRISL